MNLWQPWLFIGVVDAGEVFDFSGASFFIQALGVSRLRFSKTTVDKYLNKNKITVAM